MIDLSQIVSQKHEAFLRRVNSSDINSGLKEGFRKACEFIWDKDNPLEKLHVLEEQFGKYEELVLGMKTNFLYERDGFLAGEMNGFPLWGGEMVDIENETLPREAMEEKLFWSHEFVERLYEKQIDIQKIETNVFGDMKQKMRSRIQKIKAEAKKRKTQIFDFQNARNDFPLLTQKYKKLFSPKLFTQANFEGRRNILLRIAKQVQAFEKNHAFPSRQEKAFEDEMRKKIVEANRLPASKSWEVYNREDQKLSSPPKSLKGLEIFVKWKNTFKEKREECELKIEKKLKNIQANLARKNNDSILEKNWEYVSTLSPQFKLEANLGFSIIDLELQVWEKIHNPQGIETQIVTTSPEENLLLAQKDNEFIRRMFLQIAALAMAMSAYSSSANESQRQLVKNDLVDEKSLKASEDRKIKQAAFQQTTKDLRAESTQGVDTVSAIKSGDQSIRLQRSETGEVEAGVSEEAQMENQVVSWEITRLYSFNAWPPQQLEDYLREVKHSGRHLQITHNYFPASFLYVAMLLKQRIAANLKEMPGETAKAKKASQEVLFGHIDSVPKATDDYAERMFSYTSNI